MSSYALYGRTMDGVPIRVELGLDATSSNYRMTIVCVDPDLAGVSDQCLFSTDDLPDDLRRPDPASLGSILDGFGIQSLSTSPLPGTRSGAWTA